MKICGYKLQKMYLNMNKMLKSEVKKSKIV